MSIDSVVSRVGEILAMQQQLSDPAGAAGTTATASTVPTVTAGATGADATTFTSALASALGTQSSIGLPADTSALLPTDASALLPTGINELLPTAQAGSGDPRVQAMANMADSLVGKPYVWGGGHGGWGPQSGYDCSGFVSAVLHAGGYLSEPADTTALPSQPGILSGPGQYVTVYDRAQPGSSGHVIIEIDGQFYESGGMAGPWGGGGGVEKIARPSDSYLATFTTVLHPAGL
jgi:cell wall-associated NlpC family hydrolase